jgi:hypothetical protein
MLGGCAGVKLHVPDGTIIDIICGDHRNADVFECSGGEKVQLVADVVDVVWVGVTFHLKDSAIDVTTDRHDRAVCDGGQDIV